MIPDNEKAAVQNVERWIMAPLRNQMFFSLGELRQPPGRCWRP